MMEEKKITFEKLLPDKELAAELAKTHMRWVRFLVIAEIGVAAVNSTLLLAGTLLYGKKTLEILRKKVEEA